MTRCSICSKEKPSEDFIKKRGVDTSTICVRCRERATASTRRWREKHGYTSTAYGWAYKHGMTKLTYDELVAAQDGKCAICKTAPTNRALAVDHCHKTKKVRGLLCLNCNTALGKFKDDITLLQSAIDYLRTSKYPVDDSKLSL